MNPQERAVYLTFDDGPIPEVTPWVLDVLDKYGIKATFFMVGENVGYYPAAARAVAEALGAQHLVFLTDIGGILIDSHNSKTAVDRMDVKRAQELIDAGLIAGGMVPKVKGCLHAIENGVGEVSILDGRVEHSLLLRMLGQRVDGTIITP